MSRRMRRAPAGLILIRSGAQLRGSLQSPNVIIFLGASPSCVVLGTYTNQHSQIDMLISFAVKKLHLRVADLMYHPCK
jgi:hypothetical protein